MKRQGDASAKAKILSRKWQDFCVVFFIRKKYKSENGYNEFSVIGIDRQSQVADCEKARVFLSAAHISTPRKQDVSIKSNEF